MLPLDDGVERKGGVMSRKEILEEIKQNFGFVPGWFEHMTDPMLEQYWSSLGWVLQDTKLAARDKALVAFGAAAAIHCQY